MREQEMWQVVQQVLGTTARKVVVPAALGLGLALTGCGDRALEPVVDCGADIQAAETAPPAPAYAAPQPDYAAPQPDYAAPHPKKKDGGISTALYSAPQPEPDSGTPAGRYGAPFFKKDAG